MTRPRLIAGSEQPLFAGAALPAPPAEVYVVALCILHKEGHISDCSFICSYPGLEPLVLANLQARRYVPVTFEGVPVDVTYTFQFRVVGP